VPAGVTEKSYGARLAALVGVLSVEARQSHRQIQGGKRRLNRKSKTCVTRQAEAGGV
jgi:hypothetical protein